MTSTHETALEQANVILRYFLGWLHARGSLPVLPTLTLSIGAGRVPIAKLVLTALPPELASINEPEERVIEYLHYRQFFNIWDILDRVVECQALEVLPMSKDAQSSWLNDYKVSGREEKIKSVSDLGEQGLISQARKHILKLLTSDWLVTDVEKSGGECHWQPMSVVVIPESISWQAIADVESSSGSGKYTFPSLSSACILFCWLPGG